MTKKHFVALADAIREHNRMAGISNEYNRAQIETLADFCESQNSNFNRSRWLGYIAGTNGKNGGAR